ISLITAAVLWKLALTPSVLAELRFFSSGIAAGSSTSKLMSYFAIFYRGAVPVSMGGLTGAGIGGVAGAGGTVGWLLSTICNQTGTR
uniref:Uncharacterized protein n=1 Tax=Maylandia zebra TaxID=106582 RepID=A0A3P9BWC2_9CICH